MMQRISFVALAVFCLARPALATLGEAPSAFPSARAEQPIERHAGFSVRVAKSADQTTVREFIAEGKVFAVVWHTTHAPDLESLLGKYAALVADARAAHDTHRGRRAGFAFRRNEMVFEQTGTLRGMHGRAYLPEHLPHDVQEGDIHE